MPVSNEEKPAPQIDWFVFLGGCGVLLACIMPIVLAPEWRTAAIGRLFGFLTQSLGIVYVCAAIATLSFLLYIAISEHGNVVLGGTGSPAYSTYSWASMLFCAGIGASLIYWGAAEWVFYYTSPPFNVESRSEQAILWASSYPVFHWGPVGWAFYCLPAIRHGMFVSCLQGAISTPECSLPCDPRVSNRSTAGKDHRPAVYYWSSWHGRHRSWPG